MAEALRKSVGEMLGESFRESGILVAVFGILDEAIAERPLRGYWLVAIVGISVLLAVSGMAVERYRRS